MSRFPAPSSAGTAPSIVGTAPSIAGTAPSIAGTAPAICPKRDPQAADSRNEPCPAVRLYQTDHSGPVATGPAGQDSRDRFCGSSLGLMPGALRGHPPQKGVAEDGSNPANRRRPHLRRRLRLRRRRSLLMGLQGLSWLERGGRLSHLFLIYSWQVDSEGRRPIRF